MIEYFGTGMTTTCISVHASDYERHPSQACDAVCGNLGPNLTL